MLKEPEDISGRKKAAILLMMLGEEKASQVLKHMEPKEVQLVGYEMTQLENITKEQISEVMENFCRSVEHQTGIGLGADEYVRNVLTQALGQEKAHGIIERILKDKGKKGLEALRWMDPRSIADVIRYEHPQIIAIVLSYLESDHAAQVMPYFPDHLRADVVLRIANIDTVQPQALKELNDILEEQFSGKNNVKVSAMGGIKTAANILNYMEITVESEILDNIKEIDPELGQSIQDCMFVFDDLLILTDRDMQTLLREISSEHLMCALKGADQIMKDKIFKNMSRRASEMLKDDLAVGKPVRKRDVEQAQKAILSTVRRLADAGEISLRSKTTDDFV